MKQFLHKFNTLRLLMLLAVLVGSVNAVWADSYTITFKTGTGDGSSISTSTACSTIVSAGASYLKGNVSEVSSAYYGGSSGLKLGVSGGAGSIKMTLAEAITPTSIVIRAKRYNTSKSATIQLNGYDAQTINTSSDFNDYTFPVASNQTFIKLTSSKYCWVESVTVYYTSTPSYTITAQSNNNTYGTVSLDGSVITGSPAVGYRYADPAYTVTTGTATVAQDGNAFTVTPTSDCTVQINFEAIPTHPATFSVNGNTTSEDFQEGADIDFPDDPDDINGKKFRGWVAAPIVGTTNIEPSFVTSATMSTSDVTYYAVFATETPGVETNVTKTITTSTANLPTGYGTANTFTKYSLEGVNFKIQQMYKNGEKLQWRASGHDSGTGTMYNTDALNKIQSIVLTYDASDGNKNFTVEVGDAENPTGGTSITPTNDESVYTFDCSSYNKSYFVLTNGTGAGYLTSVAVTYKEIGPTTYSAYCTTVSALPVPTITFKDGEENTITVLNANSLNAMIPVSVTCSAGDVTLSFDSSDDTVAEYDEGYVLTYAEGTATITATFAGNLGYQGTSATLTVNVERGTTTLSFPATPATINIGASETYAATGSPSVSGITYSSSNTSALTVDSETGEITGVAKGSATITASFAGNDNYKAAETSYTILVVNPNESNYTLTNSQIVDGGPDAATGYDSKSITDANGKTWNAYAVKNYHSGATSGFHFLQIKAYDNTTASYIQVPAYGTRITELQMTVSGASAPMGNAGNSATIFFSADNTTKTTGPGVASGTGSSTVTIDCSALNLNTGYITASGAVRIWDVKVTYEYALPVGSALWTSHVTADAVDFTGVTAYIAKTVNAETISLKEITSAPANTPVIIKGDAQKTYYLQTKYSSLDDVSGNLLQASDGTVEGDGSTIFALGVGKEAPYKDQVGFYLVKEEVAVPAGKAYLEVAAPGVKGFTFNFDDATAIAKIQDSGSKIQDSEIFNLAGQKMSKLQKGVNIVNGKKVLVK